MRTFETLTEVIHFAIERENETYTLHNEMAEKATVRFFSGQSGKLG